MKRIVLHSTIITFCAARRRWKNEGLALSGLRIEQSGDDVLIWIKAVPGASRNEIAGIIGDRLKIRISAAAEAGKANKSICKLIASALGVKVKQVSIDSGQPNPEKIIRISNVVLGDVMSELT